MYSLVLTLVSIAVGVLATVIVGKYYFRKSVAKKLTPYIQFAAPVFGGIDPDVRQELKVSYRGVEVDDLYELQFIIVNTGERAIRDCIEPLRLVLPAGVSVVDAAILHVHPEGRNVGLLIEQNTDDSSRISFPFSLLNKNEGFVVKTLLRGRLQRNSIAFSIVVDDLPPVLDAEASAPDIIRIPERSRIGIAISSTCLFVSITSLYGMYLLYQARLELSSLSLKTTALGQANRLAIALWLIGSAALFLFGLTAFIVELADLKGGKLASLPLPAHLRRVAAWLPEELFLNSGGDDPKRK